MVSFANCWPEELDALPLLPNLPTLTPTAHVLRHLRTVLFGATQNGEHLTTLVARPSTTTDKQLSSPPGTEVEIASQSTNLLIDGFAHTLPHNTLPIPVYAQLSDEQPILKYLPPGDTALTAFPIAAACRLNGTDLEVTFFTRTPDIHFYAFQEQSLKETDVRLSENSLSILLRTELSNGHGLLEQRSSTTKSVQPVRMRDTTSITRVAGVWFAGGNNEYIAALATLGRHLARRRNRRITLSSSPVAPLVTKAIILRFDKVVKVRWMYLLVRSTSTKWACVCRGNGAAGISTSFQLCEQLPGFTPSGPHRSGRDEKRYQTPRQTGSWTRTPKSSRRRVENRSSIEKSTAPKTTSSASRIRQSSNEPNKEEPFMTERMTELKFGDEPLEAVKGTSSEADLPLSPRIRTSDFTERNTDALGEASSELESTNSSPGETFFSKAYNEDEASIAELCRKYLNVDYGEEVAREISARLNE
ncbi:unnamed protein product [Agarophyton chilense]|eukprot:gb/GEZJ01002342.1/.p1 GENE.gb/GEZJ01002342.1/~~gb/GEZJ01002342.1/.p1  ORF type:complete len:474 (-),score=43.53 gb/GEZJ01002342.1/:642-2063(-)